METRDLLAEGGVSDSVLCDSTKGVLNVSTSRVIRDSISGVISVSTVGVISGSTIGVFIVSSCGELLVSCVLAVNAVMLKFRELFRGDNPRRRRDLWRVLPDCGSV